MVVIKYSSMVNNSVHQLFGSFLGELSLEVNLKCTNVSVMTHQNRKNDEASYEKMLKLRRDLSRAVTILEMIKKREKSKRELLHLTLEVVEKRYIEELSELRGCMMNIQD